MASLSSQIRRERFRCIAIVQKYRGELITALHERPYATNAAQISRLIKRLDDMIGDMADIPREQVKEIHVGDFSMEEIAKAEEIIRDQERNPFD